MGAILEHKVATKPGLRPKVFARSDPEFPGNLVEIVEIWGFSRFWGIVPLLCKGFGPNLGVPEKAQILTNSTTFFEKNFHFFFLTKFGSKTGPKHDLPPYLTPNHFFGPLRNWPNFEKCEKVFTGVNGVFSAQTRKTPLLGVPKSGFWKIYPRKTSLNRTKFARRRKKSLFWPQKTPFTPVKKKSEKKVVFFDFF